MGLRNCVNRKRITFSNSFYYIGFHIPVFRMFFQHNHSLHFRGEQTRSTSIFNTGFFNTLYNSYQKGSITLSRSSLMCIGVSEIISNLKLNFSVQKLNITYKGEKMQCLQELSLLELKCLDNIYKTMFCILDIYHFLESQDLCCRYSSWCICRRYLNIDVWLFKCLFLLNQCSRIRK